MKEHPITVSFDEFFDAAKRVTKMKRAPWVAQGNTPSDTLLLADKGGVTVETSVVATLVAATDLGLSMRLSMQSGSLPPAKPYGSSARLVRG